MTTFKLYETNTTLKCKKENCSGKNNFQNIKTWIITTKYNTLILPSLFKAQPLNTLNKQSK
jgi:hypothetical protein